MLDTMRYVNHINQEFNFGRDNVLINENDFRNYVWSYNSQYNRITSFERKIHQNTLPVIIVGEDAGTTANTLFELIERDVLANKPGRMYIGDYYIEGYFYASSKTKYTTGNRIEVKLSFATDQKFWIRERTFVFFMDAAREAQDGLGYNYSYPYDYTSPVTIDSLNNPSFSESNVVISVSGPVTNPAVYINSHAYKVNVELLTDERLEINTLLKTITKIDADGEKTNIFEKRDLADYIFEKVPTGSLSSHSTPATDYSVTILDERSEPLWI